jgi:response regulator RpfG family c-di-GMP phosphodiesterase
VSQEINFLAVGATQPEICQSMRVPYMSTKRVLLIDDDKSISLVIQVSLDELAAWTILMADSRPEGLRQAQREKPDANFLAVSPSL